MKRILIILTAIFLASLNACSKPALRVMSYNIRCGNVSENNPENDWTNRRPATPAMLREIAPDIFGVQEAYDFQVKYILDNCPNYSAVGVGRDDGKSEGEHMSVFYDTGKIDLLEWGTFWLSETPDIPSFGWDAAYMRTATWTKMRIKANGKEFFFVNTHLDNKGKKARKEGLALIVKRIAAMNPDGIPMILTGDMNIHPDNEAFSELYQVMNSARDCARHSESKASFNSWGRKSTIIDYIFYRGFRKCKRFKVVDRPFAGVPYISDHYPIIADMLL